MSVFKTLSKINVNDKVEKKNGLTYLSWAWAWGEVKKLYPKASYTIYENNEGWNYHTDGGSAWVKTGVEIENQEHIEYLPVMDYRNKSIPVTKVSSFDVNKAIQRSLTKAIARHGLGLYIYAGEDLPEAEPAESSHLPPLKSIVEQQKHLWEEAKAVNEKLQVKAKPVKAIVEEIEKREDLKLIEEVFPGSTLEIFYDKNSVLSEHLTGNYKLDIDGKKFTGQLVLEENGHFWKTEKGHKSQVNKCPEIAKFYPIVDNQ